MQIAFFAYFLKFVIQKYSLKIPNRVLILGCGENNENISIKKVIGPNSIVVGGEH